VFRRAERKTGSRICLDIAKRSGAASAGIRDNIAAPMRYLIIGLLSLVLITTGCNDQAAKPTAAGTAEPANITLATGIMDMTAWHQLSQSVRPARSTTLPGQ